jgi:hypothetical protein
MKDDVKKPQLPSDSLSRAPGPWSKINSPRLGVMPENPGGGEAGGRAPFRESAMDQTPSF